MESISDSNLRTFTISRFGETYLPSINRTTFENTDSQTLYKQRFGDIFKKEDFLHVIIGLDSGLLPNYVLENPLPNGSHFLFVEIDEVLQVLNIDIPKAQNEKLKVINFKDLEDTIKSAELNTCISKGNYVIHRSQAASSNIIPEYITLSADVTKVIELSNFWNGAQNFSKTFINTTFDNLADNIVPASSLRNIVRNRTAIVIAGGPSLDENIEWIKKYQKHFFIFAVSRICSKLINNKIYPDIVLTVDPQQVSFDVSKDMMKFSENLILINANHASSMIMGQWNGISFYLGNKFPWKDEKNIEVTLSTVTNSAVNVAIEMGFDELLLAGVDLCFSNQGTTHTSGTEEAKAGPNLGLIGEWVKNYDNELVETTVQMKFAADSLQTQVNAAPHIKFINLSKKAIFLDNVIFKPTGNIEIKSQDDDLKSRILEIYNNQRFSDKKQHLHSIIIELSKFIKKLDYFTKSSKEALDLCKRKGKFDNRSIDRIEKIEKSINSKFKDVSDTVKVYGYREFSDFLTSRTTDEWDLEYIEKLNTSYYSIMYNIAIELSSKLNQCLENINKRLEEYNSSLSTKHFYEIWLKQNTPGRIYIREKNNNIIYNDKEAISLKTAYSKMITDVNKKYIKSLKDTNEETKIYSKIFYLKDGGHTIALERLCLSLEQVKNSSDQLMNLFYLAKAMFFKTKNELQAASDWLTKIPKTSLKELELRELVSVSLSLKRLEIAEQALEFLIESSDDFKPTYALVLRLNGKYQQALTVYLDYLDNHSDDIIVLLKFAEFLRSVGQPQEAINIYHHILTLDESNQTALIALKEIKPQ